MVSCPACHSLVDPGTRWCTNCHSNVQNPSLGKLASPGKRLLANIVDLFILILAMSWLGVGAIDGGERGGSGLGTFLFGVFIAYIVLVAVLFARGTTPGKRVLGLHVIREDGQRAGFGKMLLREWIGKSAEGVLGLILLVFSCLMMFTDKDRQTLHDKIARTFVVEGKS